MQWWLDLLLADHVVRDVVSQHAPQFAFWRFHRRAGGEAGHQFSLIFFAPLDLHVAVEQWIRSHPTTLQLQDAGLLTELRFDDKGQAIEAMSDEAWPLAIQRSWPPYIMGASRMMLDLLDELRVSSRPDASRAQLPELEAYYTDLMAAVDQVWVANGSHAFFHHLNALFGYEPLFIGVRAQRGSRVVV